jgi:hypothetical protein
VRLGFQHPALARALEGTPTTLVQDGRMLDDNLRRYLITREELMAAIRRQVAATSKTSRRWCWKPPAHPGRDHPRSGLRVRTLSRSDSRHRFPVEVAAYSG